jgi:hypothetical protein
MKLSKAEFEDLDMFDSYLDPPIIEGQNSVCQRGAFSSCQILERASDSNE